MRTRRRTAVALAVGATVYLALTAAIVVLPGIRLPPPVTMITSPVPAHLLALTAPAIGV